MKKERGQDTLSHFFVFQVNHLKVRFKSGKIVEIEFPRTKFVLGLKRQIKEQMGINVGNLHFHGKLMHPTDSLDQYSIRDGDIIDVEEKVCYCSLTFWNP